MNTSASNTSAHILVVDDEENILASLRRLFRPQGYQISIATSGAAALALLEQNAVDLVVSDMRMPEMNGVDLLAQVHQRWPSTMRILLTGQTDMQATIVAINKGEIFRYIAKPWDDQELLLAVEQALEHKRLRAERDQLLEALKHTNTGLEETVAQRTAELQKTLADVSLTHTRLKNSFMASIRVFSSLIEMRAGTMAGHARRVAELARQIGVKMGLPEPKLQDIFVAGLLHDIGNIGLPDAMLNKPFTAFTAEEKALSYKHPATGQALLLELEHLANVAKLIRHHHERFDGLGYPDKLLGDATPVGARILALTNDYDNLLHGRLIDAKLTREEAMQNIKTGKGQRYDPDVVDAFVVVMTTEKPKAVQTSTQLPIEQLQPGMILAADFAIDNILLLAHGVTLDKRIVEQIHLLAKSDPRVKTLTVQIGR